MAEDRFGEIKIDKAALSEENGPDVPLHEEKDPVHGDPVPQHEIVSPEPKDPTVRHGHLRRTGPGLSLPSRKIVLSLSIVPLLLLLYGVGSYFLVPVLLKSQLISVVSRKFDRPVETGRIVFSPFTLELHMDALQVGPVQGGDETSEFLVVDEAHFKFSPRRIVQGKLACRKAVFEGIELNLVRSKNSQFDLKTVSEAFFSRNSDKEPEYWPSWLYLDEVQISESTVRVDDRLADKVFSVEQIEFYLPSAETRENDMTALPKLTAAIDSSPFEINSVRFRDQSGAWRTGFSFEFNKLIVSNFKELLPFPVTGLQLTEGEADISLDIILPENQYGPDQIVIEGSADLRAVRWHDPETKTTLVLPDGKVVYQILPLEKLFHLTSVDFNEPEMYLNTLQGAPGNEAYAAFVYLQSILKKFSGSEQVIAVDDLLWSNGKVALPKDNSSGTGLVWTDVAIRLRGIESEGYRRSKNSGSIPAEYTFSAKDISAKKAADFHFKGQISSKNVVTGTAQIEGVDLKRYPALLPASSLEFAEGIADISFQFVYAGPGIPVPGGNEERNKIYDGTLAVKGFTLNRGKKDAASGSSISCRNFHFDMMATRVICDSLFIGKARINTTSLFEKQKSGKQQRKGEWQYRTNNIEINDGTFMIPLKGPLPENKGILMTLENVQLQGTDLQSGNTVTNIEGTAQIGTKGKLAVKGSYSSLTKKGDLLLDAKDLLLVEFSPYFVPWFIPEVNSGFFSASGRVLLPEGKFTGNVVVDDLKAGNNEGGRVSWKRAFSYSFSYRPSPLKIEMEELVLQQPSFEPGLSNGERPLDYYLRLDNEDVLSSIHLEKIRVEDGSYGLSEPVIFPGYQPVLYEINGSFSPFSTNDNNFILEGKIEKRGSFRIHGGATLSAIRHFELDVQDFPLQSFDHVLSTETGFNGVEASASWKQISSISDHTSDIVTRITVKDVVPDPDSPFFPALAMSIDQNRMFEMEMNGQFSQQRPQPFLLEQLIKQFQHLRVKAAISPTLIVKSAIPEIDLPEKIKFQPGSVLFDDSPPVGNYKELLQMRPFSSIRLQGMYDPLRDKEVIQAEMQGEADRERDIENRRRALEKKKILQEHERRLRELEKKVPGVVAEEIPLSELTADLDPLPRTTVHLDPDMLQKLARERMKVLRKYMVEKMLIDPARVALEMNSLQGASAVSISIQEYYPLEDGAGQ